MEVISKDFKVKHGLLVSDGGIFGGPVEVGIPTAPSHAITKEYLENILAALGLDAISGGNAAELEFYDSGNAATTMWQKIINGGTAIA